MRQIIRLCVGLSIGMMAWAVSAAEKVSPPSSDELAVLTARSDGTAPGKLLEVWLKNEFYRQVERRSEAFEKMLKSEAAGRAWQADRRAFFLRQIGGLPERTPLNPQIVGTLQGKGYRVEKILFESRPGFHVTANLYLPETSPPWPAVLLPCGHSHDGKAVGQYQRASILLAKHGMAALCYDPAGQGERYQILDPTKQRTTFEEAAHVAVPHPNVRFMCTTEHTLMTLSSIPLGANFAQYRIWDGMRAIDYLQSRKDIRADKIGCAGNSGGGTETAYLMALDDRIVAASPGCYLTTFRRLIDSKGPAGRRAEHLCPDRAGHGRGRLLHHASAETPHSFVPALATPPSISAARGKCSSTPSGSTRASAGRNAWTSMRPTRPTASPFSSATRWPVGCIGG